MDSILQFYLEFAMKSILSILFTISLFANLSAEEPQESAIVQEQNQLKWYEHYQDAVAQAKSVDKPIFILFTGSDWCSWCQKFEKEVLSQATFSNSVADDFVFLKIDFRLDLKNHTEKFNEYQALKTRYGARGFPSVVVVNQDEEIMGVTGYLPGGASSYATHLSSLIDEYQIYSEKIKEEALNTASPEELKALYQQSMRMNKSDDQARILEKGLSKDTVGFFYSEAYLRLTQNDNSSAEEKTALREKLLDPSLKNHIDNARFVATLDFQERVEANDLSEAIEPLMNFLNKYGDKDPENAWKVQMVISQFYSDRNEISGALEYAELALLGAPDEIKGDIEEAVHFLKTESEYR